MTMRPGAEMMGTMPMGRLITKMSIPLMVSMLIQSLYNVVDGIFVGQLNSSALISIGLAFPIHMLMVGAGNGLGVGMNALISQRFGRGEREQTGKAAGNCLLMLLIVTVFFLLFAIFGCEAYLRAANSNEAIIAYGMEYLQIISALSGGIFLAILVERMLQVTGKTGLSMITQISGAVVNIILDPILIHGGFGMDGMGVRGAAIATVIGQFTAAAVGVVLHLTCNRELPIRRRDIRIDADAKQIIRVGFPVTVSMCMSSVMVFFVNSMLEAYEATLAVFTAFFRLQSMFGMPTSGLVQGLIPIIGYNYGAKNGTRIRAAIRWSIYISLGIMLVGLLICQIFPAQVMALFATEGDQQMIDVGILAMRVGSVMFPVSGIAMVCANLFQGMGTGVPAMIYGLCRQCILLIPAMWLLLHIWGEGAVWYAFWVAEILSALMIAVVFRFEYGKRVRPLLEQKD